MPVVEGEAARAYQRMVDDPDLKKHMLKLAKEWLRKQRELKRHKKKSS